MRHGIVWIILISLCVQPCLEAGDDMSQPSSLVVEWEQVFESLPEHLALPGSLFSAAIDQRLREKQVTLGVEILYRIKDGAIRHTILEQFNTYLRFSMFRELPYYSTRDDRMQTLIYESFRVSGPGDDTPLPDLELEDPVSQVTIFVRQRMRDFGWIVWRVDYLQYGGAFYIHTENATPAYVGPVRIIEAGEYSVDQLSTIEEGDLLIYQIGLVHSTGIGILKGLGFGETLGDSLYHRLRAMGTLYASNP